MILALLAACIILRNTVISIVKRCGNQNNKRPTKAGGARKIDKVAKHLVLNRYWNPTSRKMSKKNITDISSSTDDGDSNETAKTLLSFKDSEELTCLEIAGESAHIVCSAGNHTNGSSKVRLKTVVKYKWEQKHYPGHLIAVHMLGNHVAYVIVNNKGNRLEGMVRVLQLSSSSRALIKGMSGEVLDIQFAYVWKDIILGIIDATTLYIHRIESRDSNLTSSLVLQIEDPLQNYVPVNDKIAWCHFVPREDDFDDYSDEDHLIVWARGSRFQCFSIKTILNDHGKRSITPDELTDGYMLFQDDSTTITWVTLSPDGTTVCVCSQDGYIRFFQVYMFDKEWRCLHQWKPHNGKPISSCFFLDNLGTNFPAMEYWKYAITGANYNTELKIWDCGTWACLQTLSLSMENDSFNTNLRFIAEMDSTAEYLVLSNLETRSCYVLQIENNCDAYELADEDNKPVGPLVFIKSIAEFPLSSGILSFAIRDAAVRRYKCGNESFLSELYDYDEENNSVICVLVRLLLVQSKSVQECSILYQPSVLERAEVGSTLSESSSISFNEKGDSSGSGAANNFDDAVDSGDQQACDDIIIKEKTKTLNPLEVLFGRSTSSGVQKDITDSQNVNKSKPQSTAATLKASGNSPLAPNTERSESSNVSPKAATPANPNTSKNFNQVNLMTPDSFTAKTTPESGVSSDVLNTILMLANATMQQQPPPPTNSAIKSDNNLMDLLKVKLKEDQDQKKVHIGDPVDPKQKFVAIDHNPICDNLTSGGSSPSREVQEIMSLQDCDKSSSSSCDDEDVIEEQTIKTEDVLDIHSEEISGSNNQGKSKGQLKGSWPKVPEMNVMTSKHSAELQNAANLISQAVNASAAVAGGKSNHCTMNLTTGNTSTSNTNPLVNGTSESSDVNHKLDLLLDLVTKQSAEIKSLQNEVSELKKASTANTSSTANNQSVNKALSEYSFKLELQLSKLLEQYMKRFELEHNKRMTAYAHDRDTQIRDIRDCVMRCLNQFIHQQFADGVGTVVNLELHRRLLPMINAKIDQVHQQIKLDVAQKVNNFDQMLKENIAQACKNKALIDVFGKSVLVGVQGSLQAAFIESMSSTLIPAYEKSSQNMFKQLHDAFSVGIKEFMEQFDNYMHQMKPIRAENTDEIMNTFTALRQHIDMLTNTTRGVVSEHTMDIRKEIQNIEHIFSRQIQETVRTEIRKGFDTQVAAFRSQANTPAPPSYDLRESIKHFLAQGQINKAFHQALLANDLNLVEFTMKHADQHSVFSPECVLEQKVLLSLMQQIAADMSNHNELKQNYLAEALCAINMSDPIAREHAPKILNEVYRNCQMFMVQQPKSPQSIHVRMLIKAIQSFMKENF